MESKPGFAVVCLMEALLAPANSHAGGKSKYRLVDPDLKVVHNPGLTDEVASSGVPDRKRKELQ